MTDQSFRPTSLALATLAVSLGVFMQVLDLTIANVALPTIAGNLAVGADQSTWVITSFSVCNAIALPLTGWLSLRFGDVRLFIVSVLLFTLASFLCGIASSMAELVLYRSLQGLAAGPMYPMAQALLISIFPDNKRGQALAILAMVTVVAPILGPVLGGWLTDNYSWRWIFLVNIPFGLFASFAVFQQLGKRPQHLEKQPMDYIGLVFLVIGVGALQIVLDKGNELDWFESTFVIVGSVISVVFLAAFLIWELTDDNPIVNLRLFKDLNFRVGTIAFILGYAGFFGINLLIPQWLQREMGYTATWAGLAAAPMGILPLLFLPIVGYYSERIDLRILASLAFAVLAGTCFIRGFYFYSQINYYTIAMVQFLMGFGLGLFFIPVLAILLSNLSQREIAAGSGLATFLRTLGASFSASLTIFMWDRRSDLHHSNLAESVNVYNPLTNGLAISGVDPQQNIALMNQVITRESYMLATNDYFYALGWLY